jgi:probable rRNA maturation factor
MPSEGGLRPHFSQSQVTLLFRAVPPDAQLSLADRRKLKDFAGRLSQRLANAAGFTCLLTNDQELRKLNHSFLGHDYTTDVLSFPSGRRSGDLGEMAISIGRAQEQAFEFGHSHLDEIRILMLHGVLHLTGLDHESDRGGMARQERKWRGKFGLPETLISRNRVRRKASKR